MQNLFLPALAAVCLISLPAFAAESPIQKDGSILVKPGDAFVLKFEQKGDKLEKSEVVEGVGEDGVFVKIACASSFKDGKRPDKMDDVFMFMIGQFGDHTILQISKSAPGTLTYKCEVQAKGSRRFTERRNLPLKGTKPMFEQYPEELTAIKLENFELAEE